MSIISIIVLNIHYLRCFAESIIPSQPLTSLSNAFLPIIFLFSLRTSGIANARLVLAASGLKNRTPRFCQISRQISVHSTMPGNKSLTKALACVFGGDTIDLAGDGASGTASSGIGERSIWPERDLGTRERGGRLSNDTSRMEAKLSVRGRDD
jgi:hypothetical protein